MPVAKTVRPDRRTKHGYRRARIKVPQGFFSTPMSAIDVFALADPIVFDVHQIDLRAERPAGDTSSRCFDARCPSAIFGWHGK